MTDKNGIEMKTGMTVRITGAYFKNDNGLYFVDNSPGDPTWCGSDYSLKKIRRNGQLSTAKGSVCFWPICYFCSDQAKNAAAREWNAEHAQIEVVSVPDMSAIKAHFEDEAARMAYTMERHRYDWGEDSPHYKKEQHMLSHLRAVVERI